ncbi:DUF6155 family protein [Larkinella sp. VNQ87]|uniref:DUF6155 family protein n=1 Tax=Larkinella sp. VNQ87 TaxID=3400921 RepID=UPI003C10EA86
MPASLKKHLQSLTHDELVDEILKLTKKFREVKAYYEMDLGDSKQQGALLAEYKTKLKKLFFPTRGYGDPKASEVRKIISDFKKISVFPFDVADLLLYRVELAVQFTNSYGDIDDRFYASTETAYEEALKLIETHKLHDHFRERGLMIQEQTRHIGWGFSYTMRDLTQKYFN